MKCFELKKSVLLFFEWVGKNNVCDSTLCFVRLVFQSKRYRFLGLQVTVGNVTPTDAVSVSADVTDSDGVASVILNWGTVSGNLTNNITMNLLSGNTYTTATNIPAQTDGTTVYYEIVAVDSNASPATTTSAEQNYTSQIQVLGWQITTINIPYQIDFETSLNNVNNGTFAGSGFQPNPTTGQLDSNSWAVTGMSEGFLNFGDMKTSGDFANGVSPGGITPGGIYAFQTGSSGTSLGVQPGGSDFTPGTITLKIQNQTGSTITDLQIQYDIFVYNDNDYSNSFNFSYSPDNLTYTSVSAADFSSVEAAATNPTWVKNERNVSLSGLSIAPGGFYYLQWNSDDVSGSGSRDEFGLDNILLIANPVIDDYVYNNGWSPSDPSGVATPDDNINVTAGTAVLTADTEVNDISINTGTALKIEQVLKVNGNITNNGSLVFISDGNKLGQLAEMSATSTITGSGSTTVQRYIPAGTRAFRFISPSVTSSGTIHANWQEGASAWNDDPNPGFGTHITGVDIDTDPDQQNGFDGTVTGNPSLFLFDNANQTWGPISNTDVNVLTAGKAYRLFVRGSRAVDLTNNSSPADATTLRATGDLVFGNHTDSNLSTAAGGFNFIGNPYRSIVNMNDVLANSTNLNTSNYYVWDPNLNVRGGYVTVSLPSGMAVPSDASSTGTTGANQFLQPGQAAFVRTLSAGSASILFEESDKAPYKTPTAVFRPGLNSNKASIVLQLYEAQAFDNGGSVADGLLVKFGVNESNAVLPNDAPKFGNPDEIVCLLNGTNDYLSIENRALPVDGETLPLYNSQYRHSNYTYKLQLSGFAENVTVYLNDAYMNMQTPLNNNGLTIVDFSVDGNIPASVASDRFSLVFDLDNLSVQESAGNDFTIYPNPTNNGNFYIATVGMEGEKIQVSMYNLLGQKVYADKKEVEDSRPIHMKTSFLNAGVYLVKISHQGTTITKKLIVQ